MAFTSHGHHIPGTVLEPIPFAHTTIRCGGPERCRSCIKEAQVSKSRNNRMATVAVPRNVDVDFQMKARQALIKYIDEHYPQYDAYEVYIVWFVKVLQHWKALLCTNQEDNAYFELTYNGDKNEIYVDDYGKRNNVVIKP